MYLEEYFGVFRIEEKLGFVIVVVVGLFVYSFIFRVLGSSFSL